MFKTDITDSACETFTKPDDPNDTPHKLCSGPNDWKLLVEHVDSGRNSLSVVAPDQKIFPLDFQGYVTRDMMGVRSPVEWRLETVGGKATPVSLLAYVEAHESTGNPESVTQVLAVSAKMRGSETCVTDVLTETPQSKAAILKAFETAAQKPCAPKL